jgi:hypothetical protein
MNGLSLITDGFICPATGDVRYVMPISLNITENKIALDLLDCNLKKINLTICEV